jgi:hypothetical protein
MGSYTFTLVRAGPSRGTACHNGTSTEIELPPEAFEEVRRTLHETGFWWMRSRETEETFEVSHSAVTVRCGGWEHTVSVAGAELPSGYDKVWDFIEELEKRGKPVPATPDAPKNGS